ncbi:MAG: ABC transporter substrate-binding protein [Alphaproteobacteria bacterium]
MKVLAVRAAFAAALLGLATALSSTASAGDADQVAQAHKVNVTDAMGRTVSVEAPADRVVVTFNYEEFAAIAGPKAFDKVVGFTKTVWYDWRRSIWNKYAAAVPRIAEIPDVGLAYDGTFSVEKVIALKPQAVIMPKWAFDALGPAIGQMEAAGIPTVVINYNAMRIETHVASTLAIGKVMGTEARAQELAALYKSKVEDLRARIAKAGRTPPKVYIELGMKGPGEYDVSFAADQWGPLMETAGGANIAKGKIEAEAPLAAEYVLSSNPDFVFIAGSNWTNAPNAVELGFGVDKALANTRLKGYLARPGWSGVTAIKNGDLYAIHHGIARTLFDFAGMQFLAKAMYPEQFRDIDPEASLRDYFNTYLPVKYEGTWMLKVRK